MSWHIKKMEKKTKVMLEILNFADGKLDMLEIANKRKFKLIENLDVIENLIKAGYLKKKSE